MAWFSNEAVCISFFFEASSWLCHLDTCLTWLIRSEIFERLAKRSPSGYDAMLSVAASVSKEGTQLPGRYYPTPPHPTPPHRIWRRCHVECGHKCVKGRNAAARTLLSHPTPPHPPASGDDAMLTVAASVTRMLASESRGWWLRNRLFLVAKSSFFGYRLFLVAESSFLVAESSYFGCGSAFSWLRKRV